MSFKSISVYKITFNFNFWRWIQTFWFKRAKLAYVYNNTWIQLYKNDITLLIHTSIVSNKVCFYQTGNVGNCLFIGSVYMYIAYNIRFMTYDAFVVINVNVQMYDNQIVYRVEDPYVILRVLIPCCRIVRARGC